MAEPTIKDVYDDIQILKNMILTLIRNKQSDKLSRIEDEIIQRGRMTTKQVMGFVNVTRPTAIGYMEKLGKRIDFKYCVGDKASKRPSICIYDKSAKFEQQKETFESLFVSQSAITLAQVMAAFGTNLEGAKELAYLVINETGKYRFKDGNKIEKVE